MELPVNNNTSPLNPFESTRAAQSGPDAAEHAPFADLLAPVKQSSETNRRDGEDRDEQPADVAPKAAAQTQEHQSSESELNSQASAEGAEHTGTGPAAETREPVDGSQTQQNQDLQDVEATHKPGAKNVTPVPEDGPPESADATAVEQQSVPSSEHNDTAPGQTAGEPQKTEFDPESDRIAWPEEQLQEGSAKVQPEAHGTETKGETNPLINQATNPVANPPTAPATDQAVNPVAGQATNPATSQATNPVANQQPTTDSQQPITNNQQSTTNSQQPTANSQQPTTNIQQPTANNQQPTANNQQPTANSQQPTANSQQSTTNSQQPTANNQQPITNNQQPTANNQQSTTNSQQPTANNQQSTTNSQQPIANSQQPTANSQQPTTNSQQPTTNSQQPTTNIQQPITNSQQPTTNIQQPTANIQQRTSNSQQRTSNNEHPTSNNQQSTANNQPPTANRQQPTTSPVANPPTNPRTNPAANRAANAKPDQATAPGANPVTKQATSAVTHPAIDPVTDQAANPQIDPATSPATSRATDPVTNTAANPEHMVARQDTISAETQPQQKVERGRGKEGKSVGSASSGPGKGQHSSFAQTTLEPISDTDQLMDQQRASQRGEDPEETTEQRPATETNVRTTIPAERSGDHPLTRNVARVSGDREISAMDRTRLIQRVARAIHAAPRRGGTIRLRLRPPELGSLHLEVRMENGGLTARLETESHMARGALLDNLPQLRDRLAEQGIRIDKFDVDLSQPDSGQSQQQTEHAHDPQERSEFGSGGSQGDEPTDQERTETNATNVIGERNLNVVV